MNEKMRFGDHFMVRFDDMSISVIGPDDVLKINVFIEIELKQPDDEDVLDDELFVPEKIYKLNVKVDINEQLGIYQTDLADTVKVLNEAKKLIEFIRLNEENFLETTIPELRVKNI